MKATLAILLGLLFCCSPASADNVTKADWELMSELGFVDLDMSTVGTYDYGSASGPKAAASVGWYSTRVVRLGFRVTIADLESDYDEGVDGLSYGPFIGLHVPTKGKLTPFTTIGFSMPAGNLGARYKYALDLRAGLKVYLSSRCGFSVAFEYQSYQGEDLVPDGNARGAAAGFLFRF